MYRNTKNNSQRRIIPARLITLKIIFLMGIRLYSISFHQVCKANIARFDMNFIPALEIGVPIMRQVAHQTG
ncbi:MAG: hypothetical protein A2700_01300 [Candidatus Blackburnbacteria bacterium RIFCSPHIGHO2_01_FULL_44_64]|nr:MAG: hypothetical protein A2700_01300 [Candidatus Blackburnbacteria bacterium RIFCSPHIGHO2_01_FULL_44_64]OGY15851.1 MAG: hypothetical protein A3H88_01500 [Candidatus Blackburnbacteria bacterium RIFCSPLOWO2_02_FULL_44_9]